MFSNRRSSPTVFGLLPLQVVLEPVSWMRAYVGAYESVSLRITYKFKGGPGGEENSKFGAPWAPKFKIFFLEPGGQKSGGRGRPPRSGGAAGPEAALEKKQKLGPVQFWAR